MTPDTPVDYLTEDEAFAVVAHLGFYVRDPGLLGSAIARPQTSVFGEDAYPDFPAKLAALFESLVRNHPLIDTNKRLGVTLTWTFALNNGMKLVPTEDEAYDFTISVAAGDLDLAAITTWFRKHLQPDQG